VNSANNKNMNVPGKQNKNCLMPCGLVSKCLLIIQLTRKRHYRTIRA
jgi:hypothetical protein